MVKIIDGLTVEYSKDGIVVGQHFLTYELLTELVRQKAFIQFETTDGYVLHFHALEEMWNAAYEKGYLDNG